VVDGDRVVGAITRGDLLAEDPKEDDLAVDHLRRDLVAVAPDDLAFTVLNRMLEEQVDHVMVLDDDDHLVGICTRTDLLRIREQQLANEHRENGHHWTQAFGRLRAGEA
jgi:CBS domain-containing protein